MTKSVKYLNGPSIISLPSWFIWQYYDTLVYKGLDVATNKATEEEMQGITHYMMGTVDWSTEFNVHQYRNQTLKIIYDIYSRDKVPILVGGTCYYVESIIYDNLLPDNVNEERQPEETVTCDLSNQEIDLSLNAFRQYRMFRHTTDIVPVPDNLDSAKHLYLETLRETVRFVKNMLPALSIELYRNTFVDIEDQTFPVHLNSDLVECELNAMYSHGVRCLNAIKKTLKKGSTLENVQFAVLVEDCRLADRKPFMQDDVEYCLNELVLDSNDNGVVIKEALYKLHLELEIRAERIMLALLVNDEKTVVDLLSPERLKLHAFYFDPVTANTLHPHNTRKVFRSIQVYLMQGRRQSVFLKEQRTTQVVGSETPVMALRFREVHIMWLTSDMEVLDKRLEDRTDQMVERGLISELCQFKIDLVDKMGINDDVQLDYTKGVLQCIGPKQFEKYTEIPEDKRHTEESKRILKESVIAMKCVTKKYARRQIKWINNRFLKSNDKQAASVYKLDCTDTKNWDQLSEQAVYLANVILGRKPKLDDTIQPMIISNQPTIEPVYGTFYCNDCARLFSNDIQYNIHMTSKKHQKISLKRKRKLLDSQSNNDETKIFDH
ncbi:tRNA dimethylallyltransferase isoform X2 [Daktulosphaira vitifoliae]|uniref:tRNA dimethylallyltransferase isoform X2 n=1 Tax=Daktulosphaira vitifoliae TaxID=58002 RepID=UPI0021A97BF6|nr:tRNA dimethylallyltransferase isoform X2 [Daktulosphaira vitifoliae]